MPEEQQEKPDLPSLVKSNLAIARRRIAEAKRRRATRLDLSALGLQSCPPAVFQLRRLRELDLDKNRLIRLPPDIVNLTELKTLRVEHNRLRSLPKAIGDCTTLERLFLGDNSLKEIPSSICQLKRLKWLKLDRNKLRRLPHELTKLGQLDGLVLASNNFTTFPAVIATLPHLDCLWLDRNAIRRLPDSIGDIKTLTQLEVGWNRLRALPVTLRDIPSLSRLVLVGNRGLGLPPEVLKEADAGRILDYYFRLKVEPPRELREVKVLFLGRGAVGKTSLIKRLRGEEFDKNEETTHGIRIHACQMPLRPARSRRAIGDVTAHIWDFGGQEIMHATHQFFLSRRSVYVVVLTGRTGRAEEDAEYWLRLVASLGGESPIIVVRNKVSSEYFEIDEAAIRIAHPQIREFVATDAAEGIGIEALRKALTRTIADAPGVRALFPQNWFRIKEALRTEVLQKNGRSWIRFPDFRQLCSAHGEADAVGQEHLAAWLHDLGIALNYREDQRLNDTTVLDPLWVTRGIYALLTSTGLAKAGGVLRPKEVPKLLRERKIPTKDYPPDLQRFLVALMRKFELCYELSGEDGGGDLVPELLPAKQPSAVAAFPRDNDATAVRYRYYVLPEGLVPRFITRMHPFLEKNGFWRRGAMLRYDRARALVIGNNFERTVTIRVHGPVAARYKLLAMIRSDFAVMHNQLKGVKPIEETEADSAVGLWVAVGELETFEQQGATQVARAHRGKPVTIEVLAQLNALEPAAARRRGKGDTGESQASRVVGRARRQPIAVFISYSHVDEKARKKDVTAVLKVLENERLITIWDDRMLNVGDDWDWEIREKIQTADLILFLVTREFLISDYIKSVEAKIALERAASGEARIAAVVLRRCAWRRQPWAKYHVLPPMSESRRAVQDWKPQSHAWDEVETGLRNLTRRMQASPRDGGGEE